MRLTFGDEVEAFRQEFLDWLAANRPTAEEMAAEPAVSSAHLPGVGRPLDPPDVRRRLARARLAARARRARRRSGRDARVPRGAGEGRHPAHDQPPGPGHRRARRSSTTAPRSRSAEYAMPVLRGEKSACLGMSEPGAGSDLAVAQHAGGARRRPVRRQRPEGVDVGRQLRRLLLPLLPHRHRGAEAPRASACCSSTCRRPASPSGRSPRSSSPSTPTSTRCSSTTSIVPRENLVGEMNNGWAMANGSLAHERGMVWLNTVMTLEDDVAAVRAEAPAALDRLTPAERAVVADGLVESTIDSVAARCLGYRGFAKLVRGGSAPEQALMKAFTSEAKRSAGAAGGGARRRPRRRRRPERGQRSDMDRALLHLVRRHDLGRLVRDPAEHHRREGAGAAPVSERSGREERIPMTQVAFAPDVFTWPSDEPQLIGGRCPSCARGDVPAAGLVRPVRVDGGRGASAASAGHALDLHHAGVPAQGALRQRRDARDVPPLRRRSGAAGRRGAGRGPPHRGRRREAAHRHGGRAGDRAVPHRRRRHRGHDVRVSRPSTRRSERWTTSRSSGSGCTRSGASAGSRRSTWAPTRCAPPARTPGCSGRTCSSRSAAASRSTTPMPSSARLGLTGHPVHGRLQRLRHGGDGAAARPPTRSARASTTSAWRSAWTSTSPARSRPIPSTTPRRPGTARSATSSRRSSSP